MEALQLHLVLLVLLAALLHASWNAFVKGSGEDRFLTFTAIRGTASVLAIVALPFVAVPAADAWPYLVAGVLVHNAYYVFLLQAYRFGDLSHVYPLARGVAPLTVAGLAAVFAGEVPDPVFMAGIGAISLGIVSLMFAGGNPVAAADGGPGRQGSHAAVPVVLAIITGVLIAGYTVVDGLGIRAGGAVLGYIVWLNAGEGLPFILFAAATRRRDMADFLKGHWRRTTVAAVVLVSAYALALYAISQGAMAHVSALRETSALFAALIGAIMLKESFGPRRVAAAAVIVLGVVILQGAG